MEFEAGGQMGIQQVADSLSHLVSSEKTIDKSPRGEEDKLLYIGVKSAAGTMS